METKVAILGFNAWEVDGKSGTTLYYLPSVASNEVNKRGYFPVKKSINENLAALVRTMPIPCTVTMKFDLSSSVGGKMDVVITGFSDCVPLEIYND